MRDLSVRAATLNDLDAIVELRLALLREYDTHPFYARLRPDVSARAYELYRSQITSPYETIFVAERGRRVVGLLRCVDTATSPVLLPERYCYVSSVFVVPSERRRGVLRALVTAAERWCDEHAIPEMRLHNSASSREARDAWTALGFEVVEEVRRREVHPAKTAADRRTPPRAHAEVR
jgi:ribosomal protein S18 acetylase RimI-like enzyme